MTSTKPQRRTNFFDYFPLAKKVRLPPSDNDDDDVQISQPSKNYTRLEDLPPELFLEIFQYLDMLDIHKGFFNLNTYLQNILFDSTFLWRVNISLMSKSNFEQLNRQLLIPNRHRIQTLNISNPCFADSIFSPVTVVKCFEQLETLIFNNVKPKYFPNILRRLAYLRNLSKLIIISKIYLENIYETVFSLPKLKYFKIKLPSLSIGDFNIRFGKQINSSIEHIVIDAGIMLSAFISLPSYVPNLQTLYIRSLNKTFYNNPLTECKMENWNHLKKIEIDDIKIDFSLFEIISGQSLGQIEILRLGTYDEGGIYLNARRWEQLILSSMPKLRVFDIQFQVHLNNVNDENPDVTYKTILDDFSSLFWIQRKWFFDYLFYKHSYGYNAMFYSMNSKRRECVFYEESTKICAEKYAEHIEIRDENVMLNCSHYFSRATQITLSNRFDKSAEHLPIILKSIIPVRQLTSLIIEHECNFSMQQIIHLLNVMPNINILEFNWNFRVIDNLTQIQQSQVFKNVAKSNKISHLIVDGVCSFEIMKTFILLCPEIKHLTLQAMSTTEYKEKIQFLISNKQAILSKLCLLHLNTFYHHRMIHSFETLVNTSDIFWDCSHKIIGNDFYICL